MVQKDDKNHYKFIRLLNANVYLVSLPKKGEYHYSELGALALILILGEDIV